MSKRAAIWLVAIGLPVAALGIFVAFVDMDGGRQARLNAARDELIPPGSQIVYRSDCGELVICSTAYLAPGERTLDDRIKDFEGVAVSAGWTTLASNVGARRAVITVTKDDVRATVTLATEAALGSSLRMTFHCAMTPFGSIFGDRTSRKLEAEGRSQVQS